MTKLKDCFDKDEDRGRMDPSGEEEEEYLE